MPKLLDDPEYQKEWARRTGGSTLPDYITTEEAAVLSGYHVDYIRKLARTGKIQADKKGGWWIYRDDFLRYVEEMKALGTEKFNRFRVREEA